MATIKLESAVIPKPQYPVSLQGNSYTVVFDVNMRDTKRGIKIRFVPKQSQVNAADLNTAADQIAIILQKQFSQYGIQVARDTEVRNPAIIGFIVPLSSISDFMMKRVIKGEQTQDETKNEKY